ncbi:FtsX-like permease family protein [Candidatus Parcubacteria bacterium]|nr:MAG: FtsX-like permease family protein [Candidatus Parcubacteria bacterium]GIW69177.1 MAG: ABC transporter permease [Candidatus Parcubacteria bacterium]
MEAVRRSVSRLLASVRVGRFLAWRYFTRIGFVQTALTVFIMFLTFANLLLAKGILVGIVDGVFTTFQDVLTGDLYITPRTDKDFIDQSEAVEAILAATPDVVAYSPRVIVKGTIESGYQQAAVIANDMPDVVGVEIAGIDPMAEAQVTSLSSRMVEGAFLTNLDHNGVVLGARLLKRYFNIDSTQGTLEEVYVGDKIRLRVGNTVKEMTVRGVVRAKADLVDRRVFILASEARNLSGRVDPNYDEYAVLVRDGVPPEVVKTRLLAQGIGDYARVRTPQDTVGDFIDQIKDTFTMLANLIGSIALGVAGITVFIIIFITAVTRQKFIGILKAVGVSSGSIELSLVLLSLLYAAIGMLLAAGLVFGIVVPYVTRNPIDFPFSEGIVSVSLGDTVSRGALLIGITLIAALWAARRIARKRPLEAMLGR